MGVGATYERDFDVENRGGRYLQRGKDRFHCESQELKLAKPTVVPVFVGMDINFPTSDPEIF